jgi:pyrroloquinoline-quinone synthase
MSHPPLRLIRIDAEIEKQSLLKHPFYVMWSEGRLTQENLAGYAMEYFQLVKAVPRLVSNVASFAGPSRVGAIRENLDEELTHIEPWVRFAGSLGVKRSALEGYSGAPGTLEAVAALERLTASSFDAGSAAMYAYEKQLPEISRSKIQGLKKHYGMAGGDATRYFELHEEADVRHAAVWMAFLARSRSEETIMRSVDGSLKAQNALLDSVMSNHC